MIKCYKFKEVSEIVEGTVVQDEQTCRENRLPLITLERLQQLVMEDHIDFIPKTAPLSEQSIPPKSIIIANEGSTRHIYQCPVRVAIAQNIRAIIPNERVLLNDYVFHFLQWHSHEDLAQAVIRVPSIAAQHEVVQMLNRVQSILQNRDVLLTTVDMLPQYMDDVTEPVQYHVQQLEMGFEQMKDLYTMMLNKIFGQM
ncbi:hypothetical protein [Lysinibacillus piscis]|uniref:Type I restriction modification DNA specificity domain-containing protein n=1 Tax=Lysinibacillus piscis TaxID=2518931 RepID=A0ABQ5NPX8_9BACI|nr:hypothetical protein [Lysinibacillus sp. KH24]GLC90353.1 hypothetical protein LYSBPC_34800 [Lysinibacillus sp. KH24]